MLRKLLNFLFTFEAAIAILCYTAIAALIMTDVGLREILGTSIRGAQRISVYLMIMTGFLGLGLAASRGRHLRPRFADGLVPNRFATQIDRLGSFLMTLVFLAFGVIGIEFVQVAYEYEDLARNIKIPMWIIQLVVPYAFFSTAVRYAIYTARPDLKPDEVMGE